MKPQSFIVAAMQQNWALARRLNAAVRARLERPRSALPRLSRLDLCTFFTLRRAIRRMVVKCPCNKGRLCVDPSLDLNKNFTASYPKCGQAHRRDRCGAVFANCQLKFSTKLSTGLWKAAKFSKIILNLAPILMFHFKCAAQSLVLSSRCRACRSHARRLQRMSAVFVRVALDHPLPTLFDYRYELAPVPAPGMLVRVPFGRRDVVGLICEVTAQSDVPADKLRAVAAICDRLSRRSPTNGARWPRSPPSITSAVWAKSRCPRCRRRCAMRRAGRGCSRPRSATGCCRQGAPRCPTRCRRARARCAGSPMRSRRNRRSPPPMPARCIRRRARRSTNGGRRAGSRWKRVTEAAAMPAQPPALTDDALLPRLTPRAAASRRSDHRRATVSRRSCCTA